MFLEALQLLIFHLMQVLLKRKNLQIILAHQPSLSVAGYEEIGRWLKLGWIDKILE